MEKRRGNSILSWVVAVILIIAAAVAIGWFAGEGLMALMSRGSSQVDMSDYTDSTEDATEPAEEAAGEEAALQAEESGAQAIELPTVNIAVDSKNDSRPSPFGTPPWISDNLSIVPLTEGSEATSADADTAVDAIIEIDEATIDEAPEEPAISAADEQPATESAGAVEQPAESAAGPVVPNLYKVRVGPYVTRQEATSVAQELAKLELPTIIIQGYYVQIGAFGSKTNADNLKAKISGYGFPVSIF